MRMRPRIGLSFMPLENRHDVLIDLAREAPPEARRRLARWHAVGAAMPVLLLRPNLAPAEIALTLEAFRPMLEPER